MGYLLSVLFLFSADALAAPARSVRVPAGQLTPFWTRPQENTGVIEPVEVAAIQVMTAPVTNAEFLKFVTKNPQWRRSRVQRIFATETYLDQFTNDLRLKKGIHPNAPVTSVSWFAARAYCEGQEMRLPTVAEWEYLAAASETKADATRDPEFLRKILNWYSEPRARGGLPAVRGGRANFYGLYDLHALIWEWVDDFNSSLAAGEGRGEGSLNRDLFCGSGAISGGNKEDYAAYMRFAFRSSLKGSTSVWNLGFRCVKGESI